MTLDRQLSMVALHSMGKSSRFWTVGVWLSVGAVGWAQDDSLDPDEEQRSPSFYPIPAISHEENEGTTYGLLGALLLKDDRGDPDTILAAHLGYREIGGIRGFFNVRMHPTLYSQAKFFAGMAQHVETKLKASYENSQFLGEYRLLADFREMRTSTDRFFGRGDDTPSSAESALTANEYLTEIRFGPYLTDHLDLQGTARFHRYRVSDSLIENLPQMRVAFPHEPGIEGGVLFGGGARLTYDDRENRITPDSGLYATLYVEVAHIFQEGEDTNFWGIGGEVTRLWPLDEENAVVLATRIRTQFVFGRDVPFWELSSLGGDTTLRGYGEHRFTNNHSLSANVETRIRLFRVTLFNVTGEVQIAPFLDGGKVLDTGSDLVGSRMFRSYQYSAGVGFRAVVRPHIVGRVDIGFGAEGMAIFVGLDYPF